MVEAVEADFAPDSGELAAFDPEDIVLIEVPVVVLGAEEVDREVGLEDESIAQTFSAIGAQFEPPLHVAGFEKVGLIGVEPVAGADVEAEEAAAVVGGVEVDGFEAGVQSAEVGVELLLEDDEFIAEVGGDVVEAEAEGPLVDGVAERDGDVVVGVDEGDGVSLDGAIFFEPFEDGPDGGFDGDFEVAAPGPDISPAVDGEDISEGGGGDAVVEGVVVEAPAGAEDDLSWLSDECLEEEVALGEPDPFAAAAIAAGVAAREAWWGLFADGDATDAGHIADVGDDAFANEAVVGEVPEVDAPLVDGNADALFIVV